MSTPLQKKDFLCFCVSVLVFDLVSDSRIFTHPAIYPLSHLPTQSFTHLNTKKRHLPTHYLKRHLPTSFLKSTGGPSGRQPGAIFQQDGRERRTPSEGAPIYQGSFEEYHIPATWLAREWYYTNDPLCFSTPSEGVLLSCPGWWNIAPWLCPFSLLESSSGKKCDSSNFTWFSLSP